MSDQVTTKLSTMADDVWRLSIEEIRKLEESQTDSPE